MPTKNPLKGFKTQSIGSLYITYEIGYRHAIPYFMFSKTIPFTARNHTFCTAKAYLSHSKTIPLAAPSQNVFLVQPHSPLFLIITFASPKLAFSKAGNYISPCRKAAKIAPQGSIRRNKSLQEHPQSTREGRGNGKKQCRAKASSQTPLPLP